MALCVAFAGCGGTEGTHEGALPTAGMASISGTWAVGSTLTAEASGFTPGTPAGSYHYLWQRCTDSGCSSATDVGTDDSTYTLAAEDVESFIRVGVYLTNTCASGCGSSATAYSAATNVPGVMPTTGMASISGTWAVGSTLTAEASGFTPGTPAGSYHYLWQRCTDSGCSSATDVGTDDSTYTLAAEDVESFIRVGVYLTNTCASGCGSSATAYSAAEIVPGVPGTCPDDSNAAVGTPCSNEELSCGAENCTDQCQLCSIISCDGGEWTLIEIPPDPGCPACEDGQALTQAAQVDALAANLGWTFVGPYTSTEIPVTNDLVISGTLTLTSDDVTVPATCFEPGCRNQVGFVVSPGDDVPGVVLSNQLSSWDYQTVTLTDTTVRFRFVLRDTHPWYFNFAPIVEIRAPCHAACGANQLKCSRDGVCYSAFAGYSDYCRLCETKTKEECACWTESGAASDGTTCFYYVSGDLLCEGTCQSGVCQSSYSGGGCP